MPISESDGSEFLKSPLRSASTAGDDRKLSYIFVMKPAGICLFLASFCMSRMVTFNCIGSAVLNRCLVSDLNKKDCQSISLKTYGGQ